MLRIVANNRWVYGFFGLMLFWTCSESATSNAPKITSNTDSAAVFVNQKPPTMPNLKTAIQDFVSDEVLRQGSTSIVVLDNASGAIIAAHDAQRSLIPASTLKIIPTATGLAMLGKDHRFRTEIAYEGQIVQGVLQGNLIVKGYGDPTLGSDKWSKVLAWQKLINQWVAAIQKAGIHSINGRVIGDATWLPTAVSCPTWAWNDLGNYYAAGIWGLNLNENTYNLTFQKNTKLGGIPKILHTQPKMEGIVWHNELRSAALGSGDNAYIFGAPYTTERFVRGTIPKGSGTFTIKGAMPNPPLIVAQMLYNALIENGVTVSQGASIQKQRNQKSTFTEVLLTEKSPPLVEIATECNMKSVNLYAEAILRAIAKQDGGDGSLAMGLENVLQYWQTKGWNTTGLFLEDASGLSPRNAASAQHLSQLLYLIYNDTNLFELFKATLAVGGRSGTLQRMFKGTQAEGRIWGKSGSMGRVRSYVGYAQTPSGAWRTFAIIANNYTCDNKTMRKKMEDLMVAMCQ